MALGDNMKRKTLIPINEEELNRHEFKTEEKKDENLIQTHHSIPNASIADEIKSSIETNQLPKNAPFIEQNNEVNIEFKPSLRTKVNKINLIISGKLNIYNIEFIKSSIIKNCNTYSNVEIILKNIEDFDITFIQFTYYYIEYKKNQSHVVSFDIEKPSNQITQILNLNNYSDLFIRKKLA